MIKTLRLRLILMSMTAFLVVLTVIITCINCVNYKGIMMEADAILTVITENKGSFPGTAAEDEEFLLQEISPETPYEIRYFSVMLDAATEEVTRVEISRIGSVDSAQAIGYARKALGRQDPEGTIGWFRYHIYTEGDSTQVTFLHIGRKLVAFRRFLLISLSISVLGFLTVFALITFFSGRIIRPILDTYEKQKRFITDASHEIKTPLTIISADTDVLEMEYGGSEWLSDIRAQTRRLAGLTNELITLSRMEEPDYKLSLLEFSVSDAVSETAANFQALAHAQGKKLILKVPPMLTLTGNEKSIRQLVGILIDNALKFSPEETDILLVLEKQSRGLRLSVTNLSDTEIPKEHLNLLFDRFYRTDPSRNSDSGGHGIGLSVAKAIVTAHGGKIQASSQGRLITITASIPT